MSPAPDALSPSHADWGILAVFAVVYVGMFLGGLPKLRLDRTGVAVLGAIAVLPLTGWGVREAAQAVDGPTLVLLFSFMVLAAQMQLGGFFGEVARRVGALPGSGTSLLAALLAGWGAGSAGFPQDGGWLAV
ncbi:MAG: anion transporter, partial [Inhella sp.]